MFKKVFIFLLILVVGVLIGYSVVSAAPAVTGGFQSGVYVDCNTQQLGRVTVYVPPEYQVNFFTLNNSGNLLNLRSATTTCTAFRVQNNNQYDVRFTAFNTAEYRQTGTSNAWSVLTITQIYETNLIVSTNFSDFDKEDYPSSDTMFFLILVVLGVICVCQVLTLFFKR